MAPTLTVVSWNVLAAPWAAPRWYPDGMDASVLERRSRATSVGTALRALDPDLALLQEITPPDLQIALATWKAPTAAHTAINERGLWSNWLDTPDSWEPNGTAVVWRTDRLTARSTEVVPLGERGNAAAVVEFAGSGDTPLTAASVHLDADDASERRAELPALVERLTTASPAIVAGDWNEDLVGTDLADALLHVGFFDAAAALDQRTPTHPYACPGDSWATLATLDHLLVRGGAAQEIRAVDAGTWDEPEPYLRMEQLLRATGSDHLALRAVVTV